MKKTQHTYTIYLLAALSAAGYWALGQTGRHHFSTMLALYAAQFVLFLLLMRQIRQAGAFRLGIAVAVALQLVWLFHLPNLSDDYYRFIWDGQLIINGMNPYGVLPPDVLGAIAPASPLSEELFAGLNELQKSNYTCYPPFNELFFALPAWLFPQSVLANVVLMRLFIIAANLGTALLGIRILRTLGRPESHILYYALNPLVIVELAGNVHFEALMVFFLVAALHFTVRKSHLSAGAALALSTSVKLAPLMFIPVFIRFFGFRQWMAFAALSVGITLLLFLPVPVWGGIEGFFKSIGLYFNNFEFNAGIFYWLKQLGYWFSGRNMIAAIGPALSFVTLGIIMFLAFFRKNENPEMLISSLLFAVTAYFLLGTTVHPWYIATPLALSVFTSFRFPLVWSFAVFFSYAAYSNPAFTENRWLVGLEYLLVFAALLWEWRKQAARVSEK